MSKPFRRIITSHDTGDSDGSQVVLHDDILLPRPILDGQAHIHPLFTVLGLPTVSSHSLTDDALRLQAEYTQGVVTSGGANAQLTELAPNYRVALHRTNSVDYNIILSGSVYLITPSRDKEEKTLVNAGELVVQRGTMHGWQAGDEGVRWICIVVEAKPVEVPGGATLPEKDFK